MRVALFISCVADLFFPEIGEATVKVLNRAGVKVYFPRAQTCCGQVAFNTGYQGEAAHLARHLVEVFEDAEAIVSPSGSCVAAVRKEYPHLFENDPAMLERVERSAARTFELSEFLVHVLKVDDLRAEWHGQVTYHDACHLTRMLGVRGEPRQLLSRVRGLEIIEMERSDWCCGFGGTFSVKMPDVSIGILDHKLQKFQATGVDTLVTSDAACIMNMRGYFARINPSLRVIHFSQILASEATHG